MTKVLLVEDDNNLREIFEMRLQAEGYNTVTAGDGEEALSVAMREKPDLIIADVMMPKLSGFEMLENLRAAPEMAQTKVIMMTALGQAEDRARGEKLGVVKYLVKSQVTLEDFIRVVREVIQPGGASVPPPAGASSTTNQESEASMPPQDPTQPTNPMPPAAPAADGQMSAADEQKDVQSQIDNFVASVPAEPAAGATPSAPAASASDPAASPAPDAGSSTDAPVMPPTSAPGPDPAVPPAEPPQAPGVNPAG
jgi:CheY-like chemotaxis protein